jgi:hypothetical protein
MWQQRERYNVPGKNSARVYIRSISRARKMRTTLTLEQTLAPKQTEYSRISSIAISSTLVSAMCAGGILKIPSD